MADERDFMSDFFYAYCALICTDMSMKRHLQAALNNFVYINIFGEAVLHLTALLAVTICDRGKIIFIVNVEITIHFTWSYILDVTYWRKKYLVVIVVKKTFMFYIQAKEKSTVFVPKVYWC